MDNKKIKISLILGTAREGRQSVKVFNYIEKFLSKRTDIELFKVDIKDFDLNKTIAPWTESEKSQKFKEIAKKSDAFILVIPEYNHSFPGEAKLLLDQAMKEYMNKPIILAGVSAGGFGGARAVESMLPVLSELGLRYIAYPLYFSNVEESFKLKEEELDDKYQDKINESLGELIKEV